MLGLQPTGRDLQLKSIGLVCRSAANWRCSAFVKWTEWTLTLSRWQHDKHRPVIIIIIIIIIINLHD